MCVGGKREKVTRKSRMENKIFIEKERNLFVVQKEERKGRKERLSQIKQIRKKKDREEEKDFEDNQYHKQSSGYKRIEDNNEDADSEITIS